MKGMGLQEIDKYWQNSADRTELYAKVIIPEVAKQLKLDYQKEFLRIDYMIGITKDDVFIPEISIESENNAFSLRKEINHLYVINSKIKVIITCLEFTEDDDRQKINENGKNAINVWEKSLRDLDSISNTDDLFLFLVIERNEEYNEYRLSALQYKSNGVLNKKDLCFEIIK